MSDAPRPGSSFEADLLALRTERGLSVDRLQQETRIPSEIIERFEQGALFDDAFYNEVYLRAFLKTYAKALGLPRCDGRHRTEGEPVDKHERA